MYKLSIEKQENFTKIIELQISDDTTVVSILVNGLEVGYFGSSGKLNIKTNELEKSGFIFRQLNE